MKIGKYEFNNYEEFEAAKNTLPKALNPATDEEDFTHNHAIVELGDASGKFLVDVMWDDSEEAFEEPAAFKSKKIDIEDEGVHSFWGSSYVENKI